MTHKALLQQALDALDEANNGLEWFKDSHPQDVNGSDDEANERLTAAIAALQAAIDAPEPEPFGWMVSGVPTVMRGSLAEAIQKREAKHIGGTCVAFPVYTRPPAVREPLHQVLTDPENQPNQYGIEFGMRGPQMTFTIGSQSFTLAYEPDEPGEFEYMRDMLIKAFSIFTPDVKIAVREPLSDAEIDAAWRSVDYQVPYDQFRRDVGRAIESAVRAKPSTDEHEYLRIQQRNKEVVEAALGANP